MKRRRYPRVVECECKYRFVLINRKYFYGPIIPGGPDVAQLRKRKVWESSWADCFGYFWRHKL